MSDFITNLATRSFTPANLLQPKLPSLFEAPSDGEPILEESPGMDTREEIAEAPPVSPTVNRLRLEKYSTRENERATPPPPEPMPERQRVARQTILPFVPEEPAQASIQIQSDEHISMAQIVRAEDRSSERKQVTGPRLETMTQLSRRNNEDEHVSTARTARAETRLSERKQDTGPRLKALTPSARKNDQAESGQARAPRLVPVIPKLEPHHPISQAENNMDADMLPSGNQSPTVHIRIGRIEVRAVTQSSPPARSVVPNRPKMTLDEYLLRRNEGKR